MRSNYSTYQIIIIFLVPSKPTKPEPVKNLTCYIYSEVMRSLAFSVKHTQITTKMKYEYNTFQIFVHSLYHSLVKP